MMPSELYKYIVDESPASDCNVTCLMETTVLTKSVVKDPTTRVKSERLETELDSSITEPLADALHEQMQAVVHAVKFNTSQTTFIALPARSRQLGRVPTCGHVASR